MKPTLLPVLRCPQCGAPLSLRPFREDAGEVEEGLLICPCGQWYPIIEGVPRLLVGQLRGDYRAFVSAHAADLSEEMQPGEAVEPSRRQIQQSFSEKWSRLPRWGFDRPEAKRFYDEWFRRKVGRQSEATFRAYLEEKRWLLDVGTGLGAKVDSMATRTAGQVIGLDVSEAVGQAYRNVRALPNAHVIQADLFAIPLRPDWFDFIVSDGVLHHTPDTRKAFLALLPYLAPGGDIAIHVYHRLGPIREFCDDYIRAHSTRLSFDECWALAEAFAKLGKALHELRVEIEIPEDIPVLEIRRGRYDLQRFSYYHLFKCFWNPDFPYEENVLVNVDWYHPTHASRHTEEEVVGWFTEAGLIEVRSHRANENGVSVTGRRPGSGPCAG